MNRREQRHRHTQPQDPPERRKQRHVPVVEYEYLITEHHLVAEAARDARADRTEKPCRGGRDAEANRRTFDHARSVFEDPFAEQHEPQREERIGECSELRENERADHQARAADPSCRGQSRAQQ
jgi:hypothetical protein